MVCIANNIISQQVLKVFFIRFPSERHLAESCFCHQSGSHTSGSCHLHIESHILDGNVKVFVIAGTGNVDAVQSVGTGLAVDSQIGGIDETVGTPAALFGNGMLRVGRTHAHSDGGRHAHIHWAVEIHLKLVFAHTEGWQHFKLILCIITIHYYFPDDAMRFGTGASEGV